MAKQANKIPTLNFKVDTAAPASQKVKSKRIMQVIFWSIVVVAVVLAVYLAKLAGEKLFLDNDRLILKQIQFKDTNFYSATTRNGAIALDTILSENGIELGKTNLLSLDLGKVQEILAKHPLLHRVKITKKLPDTLCIQAEERLPRAFLVLTTASGQPQPYPIAEIPLPHDPANSPGALLLPCTLNLFNAQTGTTVNWNYVSYPTPFDTNNFNNSLPSLFNFETQNGMPEPGLLEKSKPLAAALKFIRLAGASSANQYYTVTQISFRHPDILRATIMPTAQSKLIRNFAIFDISCSHVTPETISMVHKYLKAMEANPAKAHDAIKYLNATGSRIRSTPHGPEN